MSSIEKIGNWLDFNILRLFFQENNWVKLGKRSDFKILLSFSLGNDHEHTLFEY